jgi:hypothetical protein
MTEEEWGEFEEKMARLLIRFGDDVREAVRDMSDERLTEIIRRTRERLMELMGEGTADELLRAARPMRGGAVGRNAHRKRALLERYMAMHWERPDPKWWWWRQRRARFRRGWWANVQWRAAMLDGTACRVLARRRAKRSVPETRRPLFPGHLIGRRAAW